MRISDWSADVCSSDLPTSRPDTAAASSEVRSCIAAESGRPSGRDLARTLSAWIDRLSDSSSCSVASPRSTRCPACPPTTCFGGSEEHTSELQSLMRISYAVFCLKKKKNTKQLE